MVDPLSVSASAAGLISLGIQVTQGLFDYYSSFKNQSRNIDKVVSRLNNLVTTFRSIEISLGKRQFTTNDQELVASIESSIGSSDDILYELQAELQKFEAPAETDLKKILKHASRRIIYPFRDGYLRDLDNDVGKIRDNLTAALSALQLNDSSQILDDVKDIASLIKMVRASQLSKDIRDWLSAPDPTINHNDACNKRHPRTGLWLIKNPVFQSWLQDRNSFTWIRGFAGAGKSVLCSTAIQHTFRHRRCDLKIGIAFFYFSFNDNSKKDLSNLLKTLILQLSTQLDDTYAGLTQLHADNRHGTPPIPALMGLLQDLIGRFQHVYLLVDAIDESPLNTSREQVLAALSEIHRWSENGLHVLITSRDMPDIRRSVESYAQEIPMDSAEVDADIAKFISEQLQTSTELERLSDYHTMIEEKLTQRSKGNFRWVECQLKSLAKSPRSQRILERKLASLPESLDETYERMLLDIDQDVVDEAKRIFTLLCFAVRPLTADEIISALAVELGDSPQINTDYELQDIEDILQICPGFIEVDTLNPKHQHSQFFGEDFDSEEDDDPDDDIDSEEFGDVDSEEYEDYSEDSHEEAVRILRIAHFSVREYLESSRIASHFKAASFHLEPAESQAELAQICLIILGSLEFEKSQSRPNSTKISHLRGYAADYWPYHYRSSRGVSNKLKNDVINILKCPRTLTCGRRLRGELDFWRFECTEYDFWKSREGDKSDEPDYQAGMAVYFACILGLRDIVMELIKSDPHRDSLATEIQLLEQGKNIQRFTLEEDPMAQSKHRTCLATKVNEHRADVNAQGGKYGNALQAAASYGNKDVVQLLLDNGADINAQGGEHSNALQAAASHGNKDVVQLLLNNGADINAQGGEYGNALNIAAFRDNKNVVQLLLDRGANINAQGGFHGNALQAAASHGNKDVVQLLLNNGADINAQGGEYGNALQAAARCNNSKDVVQLLLDRGANINAQGGFHGNALQAAAGSYDNKDVVQLLLDRGANINARGGEYGNALQAAAPNGDVMQLLLNNGADINAQGGEYGNALQAAARCYNSKDAVQLLLDRGANINAQGGEYGNALQAAATCYNSKDVVQLLLDRGANINAQGGKNGSALQAAVRYSRNKDVVQFLLDRGANINAQGGEYGNALQAAVIFCRKDIVQLLINNGADINAQGGKYGNALQAAASRERKKGIVQLLLDNGADIKAQGGHHGSALNAALEKNLKNIVQLLIDSGARTNDLRTSNVV